VHLSQAFSRNLYVIVLSQIVCFLNTRMLLFQCLLGDLVSWSKECSPIPEGGFGIRNLLVLNCAMLGKWMCRYGIERDPWWRIVVDSKCGSLWGGWCSLEPAGTFGVGLWKNIRKGWESFSSFPRLVVGDGKRIRFWHNL
jgi:hypothetical protein